MAREALENRMGQIAGEEKRHRRTPSTSVNAP